MEEQGAFLGSEFLLWLWYQAEVEGGEFSLPGRSEPVGVAFEGMLELSSPHQEGKVIVRGDLPTRLREAQAALAGGRLPSQARLVMAWGETSVGITLDGTSFDLRSLKITAELPQDPEERVVMLLEVPEVLDGLYQRFLEARLAPSFRRDLLVQMRRWIADRAATLEEEAVAATAG